MRSPSYRLHKPTGQAVVTLSGVDVYLGKYGSIESRESYDRAISEWLEGGRQPVRPTGLTVNELVARFMVWATGYYRKNGKVTGEVDNIRHALKILRRLYGSTEAAEFSPLSLKAVRDAYVAADLCRNEVNRRTGIVVRAFKKPISTLAARGPSINMATKSATPASYERSDVCAVPAASVIVENVVAFEIAAAVLEKYVGTSLEAIQAAMTAIHDLSRRHLANWGEGRG